MSKIEHGYWEGGTENFTIERALEWQRERERSMTTGTQSTSDIRALPLVALVFSETPAQVERRKGFNPEKLQELADSIKSEGLLQPIVVRPLATHDYEVVAGERRVRASKIAGKEEILASVRDLTDQQVAKIQLIENLQREDVHPLAEAEGYEELLKKHGYSVDQIAAETGKSRAYIYARVKLLALDPSSRKFFQEGKLSASIALLIARIPVASLQRKAGAEITNPRWSSGDGDSMSYREAKEYIEEEYMLRLAEAPFDVKAEDLVKGALPCGRCPKNTLAQPELFGDVKADRTGVCTDPGCFNAKKEAYAKQAIARAKAEGRTVLEGKAAKAVFPHSTHSAHGGYTRLDSEEYTGTGYKKVSALVGKEVERVLVKAPDTGELIEVVKDADLRKAIKDKGLQVERRSNPDDAQEKKAKAQRVFRAALYDTIRPKLTGTLGRSELMQIALAFFGRQQHETQKRLLSLWGLEPQARKGGMPPSNDLPMEARIPKMSAGELALFLQDCVYVEELQVFTYGWEEPEQLLAAAKRFKVDPEKIRADLAAAEKPKAPAKASKKKAPRK